LTTLTYDPVGTFTVTGDYADEVVIRVLQLRASWSPNHIATQWPDLLAAEPIANLRSATGVPCYWSHDQGAVGGNTPGSESGTATLLKDGKVFFAGGEWFEYDSFADAGCDPLSGQFTAITT
jgi:hypothetical protein